MDKPRIEILTDRLYIRPLKESDKAEFMSLSAEVSDYSEYYEDKEIFGSFCDYLWAYSNGKTILYDGHDRGSVPVSNGLSDRISRVLKKRGFKYVGPVTIYSHLQACGIICDHDADCPCFRKVFSSYPTVRMCRDREVQ